ncbi:MAG: hypothetical protein G01um101417_306 [Parcubacteria group bacterium Gr01-1014_17]|nr:MAG: hypothetical protein G01um101417_306 [Parcubacteria group bacterium Gr01-1014_17]
MPRTFFVGVLIGHIGHRKLQMPPIVSIVTLRGIICPCGAEGGVNAHGFSVIILLSLFGQILSMSRSFCEFQI